MNFSKNLMAALHTIASHLLPEHQVETKFGVETETENPICDDQRDGALDNTCTHDAYLRHQEDQCPADINGSAETVVTRDEEPDSDQEHELETPTESNADIASLADALRAKQELLKEMTHDKYFYEFTKEYKDFTHMDMYKLPYFNHLAGRMELERKGIIKKTRDCRKAKNRANKLYAEYKRHAAYFTCRSLWINLQNGLPCALSNAHVKRAQESLLISFHGELDQIIIKLAMIHEFLRNDSQALFGADVKKVREQTRRASSGSIGSYNSSSTLASPYEKLESKCKVNIMNGIDSKSPVIKRIREAFVELGPTFLKIFSTKSNKFMLQSKGRAYPKLELELLHCNMAAMRNTDRAVVIRSGIKPAQSEMKGLNHLGFAVELCFNECYEAQNWHRALTNNKESCSMYLISDVEHKGNTNAALNESYDKTSATRLQEVFEMCGTGCPCGKWNVECFDARESRAICRDCAGVRKGCPGAKIRSLLMDSYTIREDGQQVNFK